MVAIVQIITAPPRDSCSSPSLFTLGLGLLEFPYSEIAMILNIRTTIATNEWT